MLLLLLNVNVSPAGKKTGGSRRRRRGGEEEKEVRSEAKTNPSRTIRHPFTYTYVLRALRACNLLGRVNGHWQTPHRLPENAPIPHVLHSQPALQQSAQHKKLETRLRPSPVMAVSLCVTRHTPSLFSRNNKNSSGIRMGV